MVGIGDGQERGQPQQVRKYPAGRDIRTGAGSLDDERVGRIPRGLELDDVVGQVDVAERVVLGHGLEPDPRGPVGAAFGNVAQDIFGQAVEELVDADVPERFGHEILDREVANFERLAEFACEDRKLACDVHARQVVARVGLGVAAHARLAYDG